MTTSDKLVATPITNQLPILAIPSTKNTLHTILREESPLLSLPPSPPPPLPPFSSSILLSFTLSLFLSFFFGLLLEFPFSLSLSLSLSLSRFSFLSLFLFFFFFFFLPTNLFYSVQAMQRDTVLALRTGLRSRKLRRVTESRKMRTARSDRGRTGSKVQRSKNTYVGAMWC